jgi:hypothetical protein
MKIFIFKILLLTTICLSVVYIAFKLPPTPRSAGSFIFTKKMKDSLLINVPGPRVIFVGGSNLSLGLNSKLIHDSLNVFPINTAIHIGFGLDYIMNNTLKYIKPGDYVVLVPEYANFFGTRAYGSEELLRAVVDIDNESLFSLNFKQFQNIFKFIPKVVLSKFSIFEYISADCNGVYCKKSYNTYGDSFIQWDMERRNFKAYTTFRGSFNESLFDRFKAFEDKVKGKNASLIVSFPCLQDTSYVNLKNEIETIRDKYYAYGFNVMGSPERYVMNDSLMFDSPSHLTYGGVVIRTQLMIEDLRSKIDLSTYNQ